MVWSPIPFVGSATGPSYWRTVYNRSARIFPLPPGAGYSLSAKGGRVYNDSSEQTDSQNEEEHKVGSASSDQEQDFFHSDFLSSDSMSDETILHKSY